MNLTKNEMDPPPEMGSSPQKGTDLLQNWDNQPPPPKMRWTPPPSATPIKSLILLFGGGVGKEGGGRPQTCITSRGTEQEGGGILKVPGVIRGGGRGLRVLAGGGERV